MEDASDNDLLDGLEERLTSHSRAFESLLALTPARDVYGSHIVDGQDPSEQWNRKKQTKEQRRAAKRAKLDPANQKSALDVIKEREADAVKRKRDEVDEDAEISDNGKRQKSVDDHDASEAKRREKVEKKREYRIRKKERKDAKKAKAEAKKARKQERASMSVPQNEIEGEEPEQVQREASSDDNADTLHDIEPMDVSGLMGDEKHVQATIDETVDDENMTNSSAPTTPLINSPAFDTGTNHSATSSSSSIIPPSVARPNPPEVHHHTIQKSVLENLQSEPSDSQLRPKEAPPGTASPKFQLPDIDHSVLQERLRQRIAQLRAARRADGVDGKPAKTRSELLEQRRKKEEQRKAAKKEQLRKAKEEEARKQEERLRGSGSPLSADIFSPRSPPQRENNFSFSRLAFADGTAADTDLNGLQDFSKKKGPQDPRTALQAANAKRARIAGYDAEKQASIAEKDMWINARKRSQGERVRDDTNLLKKALKRKEKQKHKSEQQWKDREQAVIKGKEMKQKKREANLQKRKDEKGGKGSKSSSKNGKKKARPGFEGRLKA